MTTKAVKAHRDRVAALGCRAWVGNIRCLGPATIQHARAGSLKERGIHRAKGMKNSEWLILPICPKHHYLEEGADGSMGIQTWEAKYGKQADMIDELCLIFNLNLWELARAESKGMVPRRPMFTNLAPGGDLRSNPAIHQRSKGDKYGQVESTDAERQGQQAAEAKGLLI